ALGDDGDSAGTRVRCLERTAEAGVETVWRADDADRVRSAEADSAACRDRREPGLGSHVAGLAETGAQHDRGADTLRRTPFERVGAAGSGDRDAREVEAARRQRLDRRPAAM